MARSIVLGNGNILVGLDTEGLVKDFYFPYVGLENHIAEENIHRIGIWIDGYFSWINSDSWHTSIDCFKDSLTGVMTKTNNDLGIVLHFTDVVYNEKNIFIRKIVIENKFEQKRSIRMFFGQEFEIKESKKGDTAYFDTKSNTIIHYKGRNVFLMNAKTEDKPGFDYYTTGVYGIDGKRGSFIDAEDGELSQNPIEHGPVDSVLGVSLEIEPLSEETVFYWVCVAPSMQDARDLNTYTLNKTPEYLIKSTNHYWRAWINKYIFDFRGLDDVSINSFKKSLFYIRAHADQRGAIIASSDTQMLNGGKDTYSYMWPRDASYSAIAMDRAGDQNVAQRYFSFCRDIITEDGYFMHKFLPDGSLGSSWHPWIMDGKEILPIQEDETATVLFSLWSHYEYSRDLEFIEELYNPLIKKAADFMCDYRNKKTGLPLPSYDLWEEKYGVHTYTAASVYGALMAASRFADILGKNNEKTKYEKAALEVKNAIVKYLFDKRSKYFIKRIDASGKKDQTLDASSVYGIYYFGVLDGEDPMVESSMKKTERELWCQGNIGGIARYEGDKYYKVRDGYPGNPWFVTTLWMGQYYAQKAKNEKDLNKVLEYISWAARKAGPSGVMPEQLDPLTGDFLSATPLVWSHAEYVKTVFAYFDALERLDICIACNPVN
ncbi:glycoside hydrolase family 15 protein [Candidatus Nomurabacteria bacterium]|nr:glycoside hydrolase family 15 protein [Candidatus Nomurabacteria bacterium]